MAIESLLKTAPTLLSGTKAPSAVVLSVRIRLARNLVDQPFPGWAKEEQKVAIKDQCRAALLGLPMLKGAHFLSVDELSDLERQLLVERHLISRELAQSGSGAGVLITQDGACSIMINEEDHLRIQVIQGGLHLKKAWKSVDGIDTALEEKLTYAFSPDLGYLTACPTNVGTGMRASAMLHLPGLVLANQMEKVIRAISQLGMAVRGLFGEGSDATGSIFQISNQQTLGESEEDILKKINGVLQTVIEQEENARARLLEDDPIRLIDKLGRAYGILQNSYQISSAEAMNMLSLMRLAVDLHMLAEEERALIDHLFIQCQPAHVQWATQNTLDTAVRDRYRADLLRKHFQILPPLNFEKILPRS